jgi:hypothetical protein
LIVGTFDCPILRLFLFTVDAFSLMNNSQQGFFLLT